MWQSICESPLVELLDRLKRVRLHVAYRFSVGFVGGGTSWCGGGGGGSLRN